MPFKADSISFTLVATDIDRASEWFVNQQVDLGIEKSDRLRARLLLEEALVNMAQHFGTEQRVHAVLERRFGRYRLRIASKGEQFNPLGGTPDDIDNFSATVFSAVGMRVQYRYNRGMNTLRIPLPTLSSNPALQLLIAMAAGVALGLIGNAAIPDSMLDIITGTFLQPISDMWVRLLQAMSGPIIFFTAVAAMLGTKRIAEFGGSRAGTVIRYFVMGAISVLFTILCAQLFFPSEIALNEASSEVASNLLANVLQIIPDNLLEPISRGNTPQLLLIAIVAGYLLAAPGVQVDELKAIVHQLNALGLTVARMTSVVVPYFVGLLLCLRIWTKDIDLLRNTWTPLALSLAISAVIALALLAIVSLSTHTNPVLLVKKLKGPFLRTLRNGSLDYASADDLAASCNKLLGVNGEFARACLPQGMVLCTPTCAVGVFIFTTFVAQQLDMQIDQIWFTAAAAMSVVLAVATPPLSGANLLAFVAAFSYLGIPSSTFLEAMVFDIVFGVVSIALDQALLQLETILQAKRLGFLNVETLRAPLP